MISAANIVPFAVSAYVFYCLFCLQRNFALAHSTGLPVLISPVSALNPIWLVLCMVFSQTLLIYLPDGWSCSVLSWMHYHRYRMHEKYGMAFVISSPGGNTIYAADPHAINTIFSNPKVFTKPHVFYRLFEVFGPNVASVVGSTWQRHRRLTAAPFNETNSEVVWDESLAQANTLLKDWLSRSESITTTSGAFVDLSLNVLSAAALGQIPEEFNKLGDEMSYKPCLITVFEQMFGQLALPRFLQTRKLRRSVDQLEWHLQHIIDDEKQGAGRANKASLMSILVRATEESAKTGQQALTDAEIRSNLFFYNVAGHETTANTLSNAIYLLACNPEVQEWVREEVTEALPPNFSGQCNYKDVYPKLKRCLALMQETLRLYAPADTAPRGVFEQATLEVYMSPGDTTPFVANIPPGMLVFPAMGALHTHPAYFGPDSLEWRPQRWLKDDNNFDESLNRIFYPWIAGPRICPGVKFSKVEFTSTIAVLLKSARVTIDGSIAKAREVLEDTVVMPTKKMRHSEDVKVKWERI